MGDFNFNSQPTLLREFASESETTSLSLVLDRTTDELLRSLEIPEYKADADGLPEFVDRLSLRRARLSAIRVRLKERRAALKRDRHRLQAERSQFEAERLQLAHDRETVIAIQARLRPQSEMSPDQADSAAPDRSIDDERMKQLFRKPERVHSDSALAAPVPDANVVRDGAIKAPDDEAQSADSVDDYMEKLLGRMRESRPGYATTGETKRELAASDGKPRALRGDTSAGAAGNASESTQQRDTVNVRQRPNTDEIRAAVGSLRKIANVSARTAVANFTTRKLRQSVAVTFPLSFISFLLAGLMFFLGGIEPRFYAQAFGTVMLGVIVLIEVMHSLWKMRNVDLTHLEPGEQDDLEIAQASNSTKAD